MAVKPQPKQDANKPREEGAEPLMDGMNSAMRKMLAKAKEKGFVTSAELNAVLPSEQVSTDQIEDMMAQLNEMASTSSTPTRRRKRARTRSRKRPGPSAKDDEEVGRTDDPVRMYRARWARSSCRRARAKSPSPSASEVGRDDDRRTRARSPTATSSTGATS
jgi:RNA polymerase primary sigma factor